MSEPRTEAGRQLMQEITRFAVLSAPLVQLTVEQWADVAVVVERGILAIEAEAANLAGEHAAAGSALADLAAWGHQAIVDAGGDLSLEAEKARSRSLLRAVTRGPQVRGGG